MTITKEQIAAWFDDKRFTIRDKHALNLIHDCIQDLSPKWISVDITPKKSCKAWVNVGGQHRYIYEYYICPEYSNGWWVDDVGEEAKIDFTHYMIIDEPEALPK